MSSLEDGRVQSAPMHPDEFFSTFDDERKAFCVTALLEKVLRRYTNEELNRRIDPRYQDLHLSFMSGRYAQVLFDEHYHPADPAIGFTVLEVIELVRKYYQDPFTPAQVAAIRARVLDGSWGYDNYVHRIARLPPRPFEWRLSAGVPESYLNNYLVHFQLSTAGSVHERIVRMEEHLLANPISEQEMKTITRYESATAYLPKDPSLSEQEIEEQCRALGLPEHDQTDKLWAHLKAGGAMADMAAVSQMTDTCPRIEIMGPLQTCEGFEYVDVTDSVVRLRVFLLEGTVRGTVQLHVNLLALVRLTLLAESCCRMHALMLLTDEHVK